MHHGGGRIFAVQRADERRGGNAQFLPEEEYAELRARLSPEILREYSNASAHYAQYDGWLDSLSAFFNDLFLKSNGVPGGTRSYGQTAQSLVALYEKLNG